MKILLLTIALVSSVSLYYLQFAGLEDAARGVAGQYSLGGPEQQGFTYPGPEFFKLSLAATKVHSDLRRLKFECPDGSESFTVYRTAFGVFGIPDESVTCEDGFKLLNYDPSRNFVIEQREGAVAR